MPPVPTRADLNANSQYPAWMQSAMSRMQNQMGNNPYGGMGGMMGGSPMMGFMGGGSPYGMGGMMGGNPMMGFMGGGSPYASMMGGGMGLGNPYAAFMSGGPGGPGGQGGGVPTTAPPIPGGPGGGGQTQPGGGPGGPAQRGNMAGPMQATNANTSMNVNTAAPMWWDVTGAGSGSDTTTGAQHTKLPPYERERIKDAFKQWYDLTTNMKYTPYKGQTVADLNNMQLNALKMARSNIGLQDKYNQNASDLYKQAAGLNIGKVSADMVNPGNIDYWRKVDPRMMQAGRIGPNQIADAQAKKVDMGQFEGGVGGMLNRGMLDRYMNPYTQNVTDAATAQMEQSRQQALAQIGDQAAMSGAFGGSRQGIAEGVTNAQSAMQQAQLVGNLQSQGYNTALSAMQGDVANKTQTALANQQAGLQASLANQQTGLQTGLANLQAHQQTSLANQAANLQGQLANQQTGLGVSEFNKNLNMQGQLANQQTQLGMSSQNAANQLALQNNLRMLGGAQQNLGLGVQNEAFADQQNLMQAGTFRQSQTQAQLTDQYNRFMQEQQWPYQQMQQFLSMTSGIPHDTATYGTQTTDTSGNLLMQALGMAGLANAWTRPAPYTSDERLKKDIQPTGMKSPQLGIPIKTFRWRGQPDDAPKSVGVIAQDVQKVAPHAVVRTPSGHKAVRYGLL